MAAAQFTARSGADPDEGGLRYSTLTMHFTTEFFEEIENEADLADGRNFGVRRFVGEQRGPLAMRRFRDGILGCDESEPRLSEIRPRSVPRAEITFYNPASGPGWLAPDVPLPHSRWQNNDGPQSRLPPFASERSYTESRSSEVPNLGRTERRKVEPIPASAQCLDQ
jgi:hypothetical protein